MPIIDNYKNTVNDLSSFYANAIIDKLQPKTFVAGISNGNGVIDPSPLNYRHGFLIDDLEKMQIDISNSQLYFDNHLITIPDLVYQYDSSRKEINQTVLIPVMVKSIQTIKEKLDNIKIKVEEEEDIIVVLDDRFTGDAQYLVVKTYKAIKDTLITYISDPNVYKLTCNNEIYLLETNILSSGNRNSFIYKQIINEKYNQNTNIKQVRISNERKNNIIKTILTQIDANIRSMSINKDDCDYEDDCDRDYDYENKCERYYDYDNDCERDYDYDCDDEYDYDCDRRRPHCREPPKIMLDLGLLPGGPSTSVLRREYYGDQPQLVRLISAYASLPSILTEKYIVTSEDCGCIIGMDVGDFIQIVFQYVDPTTNTLEEVNLLFINKIGNYSYETRKLNIITNMEETVTNEEEIVTNSASVFYPPNNSQFTFYYVLGSFAGYGISEHNVQSQTC